VWRMIIVIIIILLVLIFSAQNMHATQVNFPFTSGFEIRMVFLLVLCFILGYATAHFIGFAKNFRKRDKE